MNEAHGGAAAAMLYVYMQQPEPGVSFYIKSFSDSQGTTPYASEVAIASPVAPGSGTAGSQSNPWALPWPYNGGSPVQLYFRVEAAVNGMHSVPSDLVGPVVLGEQRAAHAS